MAAFRAVPYARALFDLAGGVEGAEKILPEVEALAGIVERVPNLRQVMESPALTQEKKTEILDAVFSHVGMSDLVRRFGHVIQQHYRLKFAGDIAKTFRDLINRARGRKDARIETADPVSAAERKELIAALEKVTGTQIVAEFEDNPELLAGFRIQVGSKLFDGSVDGQLKQLSRRARQK